jgi:hypothetical protein
MKIIFAHICDYATISREGKLSVMGIFNYINGKSVPVTHPQSFLAMEIDIEGAARPSTILINVRILDPDGEIVVALTASGQVSGGPVPARAGADRAVHLIPLNNVKYEKFGDYKLELSLNDKHQQTLEFAVVRTP